MIYLSIGCLVHAMTHVIPCLSHASCHGIYVLRFIPCHDSSRVTCHVCLVSHVTGHAIITCLMHWQFWLMPHIMSVSCFQFHVMPNVSFLVSRLPRRIAFSCFFY